MPPATRLGDIDTGHSSFPPTAVIGSSGDVFTNHRPSTRVADPLAPHGSPSPSPPHGRAVAAGSGTVFINKRPAVRIGDPINCGGTIATSSGDVFIGG